MQRKELLQLLIMKENDGRRRSAWSKGVITYAIYLVDSLNWSADYTRDNIEKALLNGASSWSEYSWGGCACIDDYDIARTLCTPSELKRTKNGALEPNKSEGWLDTQARALYQACMLIKDLFIVKKYSKKRTM